MVNSTKVAHSSLSVFSIAKHSTVSRECQHRVNSTKVAGGSESVKKTCLVPNIFLSVVPSDIIIGSAVFTDCQYTFRYRRGAFKQKRVKQTSV